MTWPERSASFASNTSMNLEIAMQHFGYKEDTFSGLSSKAALFSMHIKKGRKIVDDP